MKTFVRALLPIAMIAFIGCSDEPEKSPSSTLPAVAGGDMRPISDTASPSGIPGPTGGASGAAGARDMRPTSKGLGANGKDSLRPTPPVDPNMKIPPPPDIPIPSYTPTGWKTFDNTFSSLTTAVDGAIRDPYSDQTAAFAEFVKMVDAMAADKSKSSPELNQLRKDYKQLVHETYNMYAKEIQFSDRIQMFRGVIDYLSSIMDRGVGPYDGQLHRIGYMTTMIDYWATTLRNQGK